MKQSKVIIFSMIFLLSFCKISYATIDIPAVIQTGMELKTEIENKIQEIQKLEQDIKTKIKEGFAMATNCFKNPLQCGGALLTSKTKRLTNIVAMPDSIFIKQEDFYKEPAENLDKNVKETYVYQRNQKESLKNLEINRDNTNFVVGEEVALLFAKGAVTEYDISEEKDNELYKSPQGDNMDAILQAQAKVSLKTAERLARIIEIRAHMVNATATALLTQQAQEAKK